MTLFFKLMAALTAIVSGIGSGLSISGHMPTLRTRSVPSHVVAGHFAGVASTPLDDFLYPWQSRPQPVSVSPEVEPVAAPAPAPAAPVVAAPVVAAPAPPPAAPVAARPAPPPLVIGSAQQALINQDRAAAGLPPLNWSGCLASIAAGQAQAMASAGSIFHGNGVQRDWGCGLGSSQTGENVGVWGAGVNDTGINQLFMASAPHRANILGPYHYVGTAWVVSGGKGYIAIEFA